MKLRTRLALLFGLLLLVAAASALFMVFSEQPGYVLIGFGRFRYESSLWFFLALLAAFWLFFWLLRFTLRSLLLAGGFLNPWSKSARERRALRDEQRGLHALAEGRFARARDLLERATDGSGQPLLVWLGAARAADALGDSARALHLLKTAQQQRPQDGLAIGLARAGLQQRQGDTKAAAETLRELHRQYPNHSHVLGELKKCLLAQGDWPALQALLPALQKQRLVSEEEASDWQQRACCALLEQTAQAGGEQALTALESLWREQPRALRQQSTVLCRYAELLARLDASERAEALLHKAIKRQYSSELVACYGRLSSSDPDYQLKTAEGWLKQRADDPELLLALARLARASRRFERARDYYEASLQRENRRETCIELAQFLQQAGETARSSELLQKALGLAQNAKALVLEKS